MSADNQWCRTDKRRPTFLGEHWGKIVTLAATATVAGLLIEGGVDGKEPVSVDFRAYINGEDADTIIKSQSDYREILRRSLEINIAKMAQESELRSGWGGWIAPFTRTKQGSLVSTNLFLAQHWLQYPTAVLTEIDEESAHALARLSKEEVQEVVNLVTSEVAAITMQRIEQETGVTPHITFSYNEALKHRAEEVAGNWDTSPQTPQQD